MIPTTPPEASSLQSKPATIYTCCVLRRSHRSTRWQKARGSYISLAHSSLTPLASGQEGTTRRPDKTIYGAGGVGATLTAASTARGPRGGRGCGGQNTR